MKSCQASWIGISVLLEVCLNLTTAGMVHGLCAVALFIRASAAQQNHRAYHRPDQRLRQAVLMLHRALGRTSSDLHLPR